jgi:uncharacterized protein YaeQ
MVDQPDYCAEAAALRTAITNAITAGRVSQIQFTAGNGSSRMTTRVFASVKDMREHLTYLEGLCAQSTGVQWPKRYAFRSGGM